MRIVLLVASVVIAGLPGLPGDGGHKKSEANVPAKFTKFELWLSLHHDNLRGFGEVYIPQTHRGEHLRKMAI